MDATIAETNLANAPRIRTAEKDMPNVAQAHLRAVKGSAPYSMGFGRCLGGRSASLTSQTCVDYTDLSRT